VLAFNEGRRGGQTACSAPLRGNGSESHPHRSASFGYRAVHFCHHLVYLIGSLRLLYCWIRPPHPAGAPQEARGVVCLSGNYRITFAWSGEKAEDVDFEDYH
jgi:hypothetical protein